MTRNNLLRSARTRREAIAAIVAARAPLNGLRWDNATIARVGSPAVRAALAAEAAPLAAPTGFVARKIAAHTAAKRAGLMSEAQLAVAFAR